MLTHFLDHSFYTFFFYFLHFLFFHFQYMFVFIKLATCLNFHSFGFCFFLFQMKIFNIKWFAFNRTKTKWCSLLIKRLDNDDKQFSPPFFHFTQHFCNKTINIFKRPEIRREAKKNRDIFYMEYVSTRDTLEGL